MSDLEMIIAVALMHLLGVAVGMTLMCLGRSFGYWKAKCEASEAKCGEYGKALAHHVQIIHSMAQQIQALGGYKDCEDFDGMDIDDANWWKKQ